MSEDLAIVSPRDGDVLNRHDGKLTDEALVVQVKGTVPLGTAVTVNGIAASVAGEAFTCSVPLTQREQTIEASGGEATASIRVLCDRNSRPRYRYSVDDNIQWLADLGREPDSFDSLFDHWYLAFWRRMHNEYNSKIHLNIYYQTVDGRFNLSMLPERWRDEFEANSDWLHLSFHALQDKPDRIYKDTTYDQFAHDFELVMNEIKRFAGEAVTSRTTTVHWAEVPREACRAVIDRGVDVLIGLLEDSPDGGSTTYYLDLDTAGHVKTRDAWKDYSEGFIFVPCDAVVNVHDLAEIIPYLSQRVTNPHIGEMLELLIHEQYFRPDIPDLYQPDVMEKTQQAIKWVTEQAYAPCFWSEGWLGSPP